MVSDDPATGRNASPVWNRAMVNEVLPDAAACVRVYVLDPDRECRAAIIRHLAGTRFQVEMVENETELLAWCPSPGVLLAHDDGGAVVRLLGHRERAERWWPVIAYAQAPGTRQIFQALRHGAADYLTAPLTREELLAALGEAGTNTQGQREQGPQDPALAGIDRAPPLHEPQTPPAQRERETLARDRIEQLTRREREVLALMAEGLGNREIGERLSISSRTVEIHRANLIRKLGVDNSILAARVAFDAGLTS